MAKNKSEILQGTLDLMVPKTLTAMGPLHGYGLARGIEPISEQTLEINQGTISASLVCLQQTGLDLLGGFVGNNRRAKFYCITKAGRKQLSAEAANWERISGVIGRVLQIAERS